MKDVTQNVNRGKNTYLIMGYVFALAMVLVAFEFKTFYKLPKQHSILAIETIEEESLPIIILQNKVLKKPEIKKTHLVEPVPDEKVKEEFVEVIDPTEKPDLSNLDNLPDFSDDEAKVVEEKVWFYSEINPSFPGGEDEMFRFLAKETKYPASLKQRGVSGSVYIQFVVERDGSLSNIKFLNEAEEAFKEEALRVLKKMPLWNAGIQNGKPVRVQLTLPLKFSLKS